MLNDEHNTADPSLAPGSNHEDSSTEIQLSANTRARLAKLAPWRIDPASLKFPKHCPNFEGGNATVSRALLASPSDETREQVVEPNARDLIIERFDLLDCGLLGAFGVFLVWALLGGFGLMLDPEREVPNPPMKSNNCSTKSRGERVGEEAEGSNGGEAQESDDETSGPRKPVAVKKMKLRTQDDTVRILGLTLREAEFLVKLSHENVIELEGFIEDASKGQIWLVFPWEENGTLKDFVASYDWEIPERISLIDDVAGGVAYLHGRSPPICHGDLKSINILVNSKCRAVITDFGSARHPIVNGPNKERERTDKEFQPAPSLEATLDPSTNTITLTCNHYTLRWAAPELLEEEDASLACDIWAFGWVAYEVITNSIPFQDVKDAIVIMRIVRGDLPSISSDARMVLIQALCSFLGHCWSVNPAKRPTAEDCQKALRWMPKIIPKPRRETDTENQTGDSAELLIQLGHMYRHQSDYSSASKYYATALSVYSDVADIKGKAEALFQIAQTQRFQQQYSQAATSYSEALKIYTDVADNLGIANALWGLADVHRLRKEYDEAVKVYSECLQFYTDVDNKDKRAAALWGLAEVHRIRAEYDQAAKLYSECLQIQTDSGFKEGSMVTLWSLAIVHHRRKEYSHAMKLFSEALIIAVEVGDKTRKAFILYSIALVHHDQHDYKIAIDHYEQAAEIFKQLGHTHEALALKQAADLRRLIEDTTA